MSCACRIVLAILAVIRIAALLTGTAAALSDSEKAAALLAQGIPQTFLDSRTGGELQCVYENLNGKTAVFFDTRDGTVNRNDENAGGSPAFSVTTVGIAGDNPDEIERLWVFIAYRWPAGAPVSRQSDSVSVSWNRKRFVYASDSFQSADYYRCEPDSGWTEYCRSTTGNPTDLSLDGLGYEAASGKAGLTAWGETLAGYASFCLLPAASPMSVQTAEDGLPPVEVCYTQAPGAAPGMPAAVLLALAAAAVIAAPTVIRRIRR